MKTLPAVRSSAAALVLLLLGGLAEAQTPPFPFLTTRGTVNDAMRTIWTEGFSAPRTSEASSAAAARIAAATRVLQANRAEAQATLLASLRAVRPDDLPAFRSLATLVQLLGDDPAILDQLKSLLMTAPPPLPSRGDDVTHPNRMLRQLAVSEIADLAGQGSKYARRLLPDLVTSPDNMVVASAVRTYYALNPNRRLAQRALRQRMPVANRYLLYVD